MYPILFHIYGPLSVNSFGVAIALGVLIFLYFTLKHPYIKHNIGQEEFLSLVVRCTIAGVVGGRLLHIISEWQSHENYIDMLSIWNGGLSIFGAVIGILSYGIWFLYKRNINVLRLFDITAVYAPLIHCVARIGCFLAGCCHGMQTSVPWAIVYTNSAVAAPLNIKLHPTQLYSSLIFLMIFLFLQFFISKRNLKSGQIGLIYLILLSLERFIIDFFRGDRIINTNMALIRTDFLSMHQWIAIAIFVLSCLVFFVLERLNKPVKQMS